jgi:alkaline phosphatase D
MRRFQLDRRSVIQGVAASATGLFMPSISRAADRPAITHGVQSGDMTAEGAVVWARADRPSRLQIEFATTESFKDVVSGVFVDALPSDDFTAKALIEGLPSDQDVFFRIRALNHADPKLVGESAVGHFRTAPTSRRSVSFCWSGDTVGQGWGIDEARGGMKIYATMQKNRPDFFIHSGDNVYADGPLKAEVKLADGSTWKNLVIPEKSKPAETLDEFRGQYKYNLMDKNLLGFYREVPVIAQWDDHEVTNNWYPDEAVLRDEHKRKGYQAANMMEMAARASKAFREYMPMRFFESEPGRVYRKVSYGPMLDVFVLDMRSYRGANGENRQTEYGPDAYFLGPKQVAWLKRELANSKATWKVIAADMPIGLVVVYDFDRMFGSEAIAQGNGPALGRELEIADLLAFIKRAKIRNTVWLTADVHYTAAHYYDPDKAQFQDFDGFYEFVSGPLNAGTFGPNDLDNTFGPQILYQKVPTKEQGVNLPPSADMQFFGHVAIDGATQVMKVTLKDWNDVALWSIDLEPKRA